MTKMLTAQQVAEAFGVDPKTVTRWARKGKLHFIRTLGGHRRYYEDEINWMIGSTRDDE